MTINKVTSLLFRDCVRFYEVHEMGAFPHLITHVPTSTSVPRCTDMMCAGWGSLGPLGRVSLEVRKRTSEGIVRLPADCKTGRVTCLTWTPAMFMMVRRRARPSWSRRRCAATTSIEGDELGPPPSSPFGPEVHHSTFTPRRQVSLPMELRCMLLAAQIDRGGSVCQS